MKNIYITFLIIIFVYGCSNEEDGLYLPRALANQADQFIDIAGARIALTTASPIPWDTQIINPYLEVDPVLSSKRLPLFGDLHVHTKNSFDAYVFGTIATPNDAYEFAKGKPIIHPAGFSVSLKKPLDFYAVTDHGTFLGQIEEAATPGTPYYGTSAANQVRNLNSDENRNLSTIVQRRNAFGGFLLDTITAIQTGELDISYANSVSRDAWLETIEAAERHNDPGNFTTFVGYEYTASTNDFGNLHRNVIFRGDTNKLPALPFSRGNSVNPEDLWDWMDKLREDGIESLAIPHNSNGSNGAMFKLTDWSNKPFDKIYADKRLRNEPIVEITQVKGTSDTHPILSENDEWADFEIMPYKVATMDYSEPQGSYVRDALMKGIMLEEDQGINPYRFGLIGSSDTHTAASSQEESNFFSKIGLLDSTSELRGSVPVTTKALLEHEEALVQVNDKKYFETSSITWGAAGLAGVWAEENTRDSIYGAFRRKEVFATSGPRIKVRFFAGYDLDQSKLASPNLIEYLYSNAVTMGSELIKIDGKNLQFFVWAVRDLDSAPLQRIQIIKGYVENNTVKEKVYDAVCSDGSEVNPITNRCPDNGAKVNLTNCEYSNSSTNISNELSGFWTDPDFNQNQRAFYYVRVLEDPTCRWSTWDAIRAGTTPREDITATIQERAWSSPIHVLND